MPQGTVTAFNANSGFGYITADDGTRLFVDFTAIVDGHRYLRSGERVTFDTAPGSMGLHAVSVCPATPV